LLYKENIKLNTISKLPITKGIKISCNRKTVLYLKVKHNKEMNISYITNTTIKYHPKSKGDQKTIL